MPTPTRTPTESSAAPKPSNPFRQWHPAFQKLEADPEYGVDLGQGRIETNRVILPRGTNDPIVIPLDADGNFDPSTLWSNLPKNIAAKAKPFTEERIWHMGIVLAARELRLDLDHPNIDLARGRITLTGPNGIQRAIPVDENGYFYIDWRLRVISPPHPGTHHATAPARREADPRRNQRPRKSLRRQTRHGRLHRHRQ